MLKWFVNTLSFLYETLLTVIIPLARWHPRLKNQMTGRTTQAWEDWPKERFLFFVSSAGELEQALPLADKIPTAGIFVFSKSGTEFASRRNIPLPLHLAPLDRPSQWQKILDHLRPKGLIVVRYEIWPGFVLACLLKQTPLFLINGSGHPKALRRFLLSRFRKLYLSNEEDAARFAPFSRMVTGDTKYDQASHRQQLEDIPLTFQSPRKTIVCGSIYTEDWQLLVPVLAKNTDWNAILAPHHVDGATIEQLQAYCDGHNLDSTRFTRLEEIGGECPSRILILDCVGLLAPCYKLADLAYIGGAQHRQIHNVLEAAAAKTPLIHGPRYHNAHEAVDLVRRKLANVVSSRDDIHLALQSLNEHDERMGAYMSSQLGAADRIAKDLLLIMDSPNRT